MNTKNRQNEKKNGQQKNRRKQETKKQGHDDLKYQEHEHPEARLTR